MPVDIIDEIRSLEHKADRMNLREKVTVALGIVCFIFLIGLAVAWSTKAYAEAPQVTRGHPADCPLFADIALISRAMAESGVKVSVAANIVVGIYDLNAPLRPEIAAEIVSAAYRTSDDPKTFGGKLLFFCQRQGGEMKQVLVADVL